MVALNCDPFQTVSLALYGEWAKDECGIICSLIKEGDFVLDVGANIGTITVAMAKRVGSTGRVFAFEPQTAAYYCLCGNVALTHALSNVRALNMAVSDFDGVIQVPVIDVNQPFNVGGVRLADPVYDAASNLPKEDVACVKIDSLQLPRVDFIKIDVETMEAKVLAGSVETVRRCRPVIMAEALLGELSSVESLNVAGMIAFFKEHNYVFRVLRTDLFSPDNIRYCPDNVFPGDDQNILAIPAEKPKPEGFDDLPKLIP